VRTTDMEHSYELPEPNTMWCGECHDYHHLDDMLEYGLIDRETYDELFDPEAEPEYSAHREPDRGRKADEADEADDMGR
jgi:hypothetical protein